MLKKAIAIILILVLNISAVPAQASVQEKILMSDNFESYEGAISRKLWYGQTTKAPAGVNDLFVSDTERGKSVEIVTAGYRQEVIRTFNKSSANMECIKFSFSIYFGSDSSSSSLWTYSTDNGGEKSFVAFGRDGMVSINGNTFTADEFTRQSKIWYDVDFYYNVNDGAVRLDIADENGKSTSLFGSYPSGIGGFNRFNLVTTGGEEGAPAVTYLDDVTVSETKPFRRRENFAILCENFDKYEEGTKETDNISAEKSSDNKADIPVSVVKSDRGNSLKTKFDNGYVKLSHSAKYLSRGTVTALDISFKTPASSNAEIMLDNVSLFSLEFGKNTLLFAGNSYRTNLLYNVWYDIKLYVDTDKNEAEIFVSSEKESVSYKRNFTLNKNNIKNLHIKTYGENEGEVYIDNIHLYTKNPEIPFSDVSPLENTSGERETLIFSDYFEGTLPAGWKNTNGACEKEFDCENVKIEAEISIDNDMKSSLTLGGVDFVTFEKNKVKILGNEIKQFYCEVGKDYLVTVIYNSESGYTRVHIDDGEERKTFEGEYSGNFTNTVGYTEGIIPSKISVYETSKITYIKNTGDYSRADQFENYLVSTPPAYKKSGLGSVNPVDTIHGISVELSSKNGENVSLCKNTEINQNIEKTFMVSFSICKMTDSGENKLYIKDENGKEISLFSIADIGVLSLGKNAQDFAISKNIWYDITLFVSREGKITGKIKNATNEYTFSGETDTFGENVKNIFVSLKGTSGEISRLYFDNFRYVFSGLCDFEPKNVLTNTKILTLTFSDDVNEGTILINGQDKNIEKVEFSENKAYIYLKGLEANKEYTLSYAGVMETDGNGYNGNIKFAAQNLSVNVKNIGFKNTSGKDTIGKGEVYAYATVSSDEERTVTLYMAAYSKKTGKLLGIASERKNVGVKETDFEKYLILPEDFENINIKFFLWADGKITPLTDEKNTLSPFNIPSGKKIIETVKERMQNVHPRIMVTRDKVNEIRKGITENEGMAGDYFALIDNADTYLRREVGIPSLSDGRIDFSRSLLSSIRMLGMAYQISGNEKYAERIFREMESAAVHLADWNPQGSFLDTAAMIEAFSLGYDFIYDYIKDNNERKNLIFTTLNKYGLDEAKALYNMVNPKGGYRWTTSSEPDNWNIICNSASLIAALVFCDEYPSECEVIFDKGFKSLQMAARRFAPDGAWFEGVSYWHYQMGYYVDFLMGMDNTLGTDYGFTDVEGFEKTAYYLVGLTGGSGRVFNYANCINENIYSGALYYLADKFNDSNIFVFQKKFLKKYSKSLPQYALIYNDYKIDETYTGMKKDFFFKGEEVCSMRSGWEDTDTFVAMKGGRSNFSHGHLDAGEFVIDMLGERFAMGLGQEDYSVPFNDLTELYRRRAEGHNTLVINPSYGPDQVRNAKTVINRFDTSDSEAIAVCDMTAAYADNAKKALRGIKLCDGRRAVLIRDEIETFGESEIYWFMHTDAEISISEDGKTATLTKNKKKIKAEILNGGEEIFEVMDAQPLPTSPKNELQNKNEGIKKLLIHFENVETADITVLISPYDYVNEEIYDTPIICW